MNARPFGSTRLRVTEFGIGCARIGGIFQGDASAFLDLFAMARDVGINFFDTADIYSQGESESLLGRAFRVGRDRVIIASKAGYVLPARRRLAAFLKPLVRPLIRAVGLRRDMLPTNVGGKLAQDFSAVSLRRAVEASLRRLRTDYLDILQLHSPPLEIVERGEWESTLESLKRAGKIRYYGVACDTLDVALAALQFPRVSAIQFTLSLLEQRATERLLPEIRSRNVAFIARECLANGLLAKGAEQIDLGGYCKTLEERGLREGQLVQLRERASAHGRSLTSLALEYVRSVDSVSVALLGVRSIEQLQGLLQHARR
jgi:aryl-alcohol dehydrogenase-like predicted oxidoreductase